MPVFAPFLTRLLELRCRRLTRTAWLGLVGWCTSTGWAAQVRTQAGVHAGHADSPVTTVVAESPAVRPMGDLTTQPASTRRMVQMLQEIWRMSDPRKNPYRSRDAVRIHEGALAALSEHTPLQERQAVTTRLGSALLQAGETEAALEKFKELELLARAGSESADRRAFSSIWKMQALSHLRLGEQENCLHNHNADSCLFPIQGGGVHVQERGSRGAIRVLERMLQDYPGDLRARWLLNIAYMTLGEYPDQVPARFRIDPNSFASDFDLGRFPDVAGPLGLDIDDLAGGVVMEDFDHDGFLDLMISGWGFESQLRVFRNNGDGSFTERTREAGLTGLVSGLNMIHGDCDNDGFMDVLVLRGAWLGQSGHHPNSLLRNNGDFTFTDITEEAGILSFRPTQTATWFDYNGDGWLDVFIANETSDKNEQPCELFRNNGNGTFTECAVLHGLDLRNFFKGVTAGDYNNDGRPDLFLTSTDGLMTLVRNDGPATRGDTSPRAAWRFSDATTEAGLDLTHRAFPCWFWDYNNDGWLDIMSPGYSIQDVGDVAADYLGLPHAGSRMRLFRNQGNGTFRDVSQETGLFKLVHAMGSNYGDLDNDGWLDCYFGTGDPDFATLVPNRMFRNEGGRRFQDVTASGGFGQLQKGHGIAFGDVDNDGDQDVYSVVGGAVAADRYPNQLFANPGHGNHSVKLILEGVTSNRPAIGARIKVIVATPAGERALHRVVGSGGSFGATTMRQEIGLGDARAITRVEIFWPVTGRTQVVTGLDLNQCYRIREDTPGATLVRLGTFSLPKDAGTTPHQHHGHHASMMPGPAAPLTTRTDAEWCAPAP